MDAEEAGTGRPPRDGGSGSAGTRRVTAMAEPVFRTLEISVTALVTGPAPRSPTTAWRTSPTGGAVIAINHTSYVDWLPPRSPSTAAAAGSVS